MEQVPYIFGWQWWLLLFGIALFLGLEWWVPFQDSVQSKFLHVATNLTIAGGNAAVLTMLAGGILLTWTDRANREGWGLLHHMGLGLTGKTIASVVLLDLVFYLAHRANHRFALLWRFHRAHHSDLQVDVTTALRFHLGEVFVSTGIKVVIIPVIGVPVIGWVAYEIVTQAVSQFQHSNIRLSEEVDRHIRRVFVTPHMHWIHHSRHRLDHNANYGVILSAWDRWFETYRMQARREEIHVGLNEYSEPEDGNLLRFLAIPFRLGCR